MSWTRALRHRFVFVPLALAAIVAAWNAYIAMNDDGIIEGEVRDANGRPVGGATVIFFERNFVNYQDVKRARTDERGAYSFTGMQVHVGQLEARTDDGRRSERLQMQLWFRAQNVRLPPLIVPAPRP